MVCDIGVITIMDLFMVGGEGAVGIYLWVRVWPWVRGWSAVLGEGVFGAGWGGSVGLVAAFACSFTAVAGDWFLGGDWALGCVSAQIWDIPNVSLFPRIVSLKSFGTS